MTPDWFDLKILWALLLLDGVSTQFVLTDFAEWLGEGNPVMRKCMQLAGSWPALAITHIGIGWYYGTHAAEIGIPSLWLAAGVMAAVGANNLFWIYRALRLKAVNPPA